jgi:Fe-S-cluster containining protein
MQTWIYIVTFAVMTFYLYVMIRRRLFAYLLRKKEFKCTRCGECCKLLVRLKEHDIRRIAKLGHDPNKFVNIVDGDKRLKQVDGYCIFLLRKDGLARCTIYNVRPKICKDFPKIPTFSGKKGWDYRCHAFDIPKWL